MHEIEKKIKGAPLSLDPPLKTFGDKFDREAPLPLQSTFFRNSQSWQDWHFCTA